MFAFLRSRIATALATHFVGPSLAAFPTSTKSRRDACPEIKTRIQIKIKSGIKTATSHMGEIPYG